MAKFKFSKSTIDIEIEDHVFTVDINDDLQAKAMELGRQAISLADVSTEAMSTEEQEKLATEIIEFCAESIDAFLGSGAYDKIFDGRRKNYMEHIDVWGFIVAEITTAAQNYNQNITSKYNIKKLPGKPKKK